MAAENTRDAEGPPGPGDNTARFDDVPLVGPDGPDSVADDTVDGVAAETEGLPDGTALLVVKRGPNAGSRFLLDQPITSAGRHPTSDVFLDDITVSRRHVEFRRKSGEFTIVDIGSLNGTYVNNRAVDAAVLANGDEVRIGNFRLVFLTGRAAD